MNRGLKAFAATEPCKPGGDEEFELTAEDEAILDRIWAQIREEELSPTITETMTDEETLELFGLD